MKQFLLITVVILTLISCTRDRYYRTKTGLLYHIIETDTTQPVASMGTTVKINYTQTVRDSVISTTYGHMPLYYMVMPHISNYNPLEVFDYGVHQGDSMIVKQRIDSMMAKKIFKKKPEWMADDDEWITHLKVEKVFQNDSLLQADKQMESKRIVAIQTKLGMERIKQYLNKNNITAKAHENMFCQVLKEGTGAVLDSGNTVMMDFEVKTLKGKVINSTIDSTFHNMNPKPMTLGTHEFPEAIETFLETQKAGGSVMIYTPAVTLYGATPEKQGLQVDDDISILLRMIEN